MGRKGGAEREEGCSTPEEAGGAAGRGAAGCGTEGMRVSGELILAGSGAGFTAAGAAGAFF